MARKIIAGNWKMNLLHYEALDLVQQLSGYCLENDPKVVDVIVAPTQLDAAAAAYVSAKSPLNIAAQNCSEHEVGAYTGEVSAKMIKSAQLEIVIVGHSERRQFYGDTLEVVKTKVNHVLAENMMPILCVGESLDERKSGKHEEVVKEQLVSALEGLSAEQLKDFVVAYEPVWAIGTGETASPEQAQEMHKYIREQLAEIYGTEVANKVSLLYGGSVKPSNAKSLFSQPDIDGGLVGGASLKYKDFIELIEIGKEVFA